MKIYISGAITVTDDYMTRFVNAQKELKEQGYSAINPAMVNSFLPLDTTHEQYMKMSFCMLDMCDTIYLLKGWEKSMGANQEYGYALAKGYTILKEENK